MVQLPFSKDPAFGVCIPLSSQHKPITLLPLGSIVPFTNTIYIDRSDFRETASKDFFRLAPGGSVRLLKVPFPITATGFETDPTTGPVTLVRAHYEKPEEGVTFKKPKT
jgi:glutaminyl-tRNA synthetase